MEFIRGLVLLNRNNKVHFAVTTSAADTLLELLEYYRIPQQDFADRVGVSQKHVSDLLKRKKFLSADLALRVQRVTGIPAEMLLGMDMQYKLAQGISEASDKTEKYLQAYDWVV